MKYVFLLEAPEGGDNLSNDSKEGYESGGGGGGGSGGGGGGGGGGSGVER